MSRDFEYDVFVSYSSKDRAVVQQLAERLKDEGLKVFFDEWSIKVGDHIFLSIEKGLQSSRALMLCLSETAIASQWVDLERGVALFRDPTNADRRFVPVMVADCKLPDTLRAYKYVDYRGRTEAAYKQVLGACRGDQSETGSAEVEKLALTEIASRCDELRKKAELLLASKSELRSELAAHIKVELGQEGDAWPDDDLAKLLENVFGRLKTSQLLRIFLKISRRPSRSDGLEECLGYLVPIVYWNEIDRYRAKISKDWMRLPIVEAAYADIVQAAYDGRRLELFCTPEAALRSKLALDAPQLPETSISTTLRYEELVEHLHNELVGKILYRDSLLRKNQFEITQQMPPSQRTRQRAKIINSFLEREQQDRKRVYFLLIDKVTYTSYGEDAEEFLRGFRDLLPALRIVVLEGDWEQFADESIGIEDLLQILQTLAKPVTA